MHCLKFQVDLENHTNMQQYHTWLPAWPPILDSGSQNTSGRKTPELNLKILDFFLTLVPHFDAAQIKIGQICIFPLL